jgi:acyl carrier protein
MNEVSSKVHHIIGTHLGVADNEVTDDKFLVDDLNADTLAVADIATSLEEVFKIEIPHLELQKFNTVGDVVTYVSEHLNEL